ncbi:hypothetical protein [Streptomyces sp. NPDC059979]|uniref:hypothetical protein n=1 Tax=Streptomyces sp. NPDC059979 TaxID=3347021 RepID=UPI003679F027
MAQLDQREVTLRLRHPPGGREPLHRRQPNLDYDKHRPNNGPHDQRWLARNARVHVCHHADECRPMDPRMAEAVQQIANEKYGVNNPTVS